MALLGTVAYLLASAYTAMALTRPDRLPLLATPDQLGLAYEPVEFPSRVDRLRLSGWLLEPAQPEVARRPVVMVHDKGTDRERGVFGHILQIAARLVRQDYPVLLFDLRGSGQSSGTRFTMGAREPRDVGGAIDFLRERGLANDGVNLFGFSMGAATALLTAPGEPLVRAVAEDSSYADLGAVIDQHVREEGGWWNVLAPGTLFMGRLLLGIDARGIRPVDDVPLLAQRSTPLLVIHGERDSVVPFSQAQLIASRYGAGAQTFFVPGAEHLRSYETNPSRYTARVARFFAQAERADVGGDFPRG